MTTVDLHCHMLPGIDDGSKTLEQSLTMARLAVADGIRVAVMTPHHLNGVYVNQAADIRRQVRELQASLLAEGIGLRLVPGSEIHLVPEAPGELSSGKAMTVADRGRAALVELPVHTVPYGASDILGQIISQGITPIIAHPERNSELRRHPEMLAEWVDIGCLAQVTAQSCTGLFGPQVRDAAEHMVCSGLIHVAASDAHRDHRRIPQLSEGRAQIAEWTNETVAELLCATFPSTLVAGRDIERERLYQALPPPRKRSFWRRVFGDRF